MAEFEMPGVFRTAAYEAEIALVHALRNSAPGAVAQLYQRYGTALYRYVASLLVGDRALAEEIVMQSFIDVVQHISRFDARKSSFSAWLYGIARRHANLELRRQRRRKAVPAAAQVSLEALAELPQAQDLAQEVSARLDAQRQLAAVAEVLTELEMEVLVLHSLEEFSLDEVGRIIGRSARAVHSLLHRARQKARERLTQDGTE